MQGCGWKQLLGFLNQIEVVHLRDWLRSNLDSPAAVLESVSALNRRRSLTKVATAMVARLMAITVVVLVFIGFGNLAPSPVLVDSAYQLVRLAIRVVQTSGSSPYLRV